MSERRAFIQSISLAALTHFAPGCRRRVDDAPHKPKETPPMTTPVTPTAAKRMPVLFVGHGSPMNAVEDNRWSRGFSELGRLVPAPVGIVVISAHWYVEGTFLTDNASPRTIHDFSGFPRTLYEVDYPAPGSANLAKRVRTLLGEAKAKLDDGWGLDHGTWSVLRWTFPRAEIPVIQLSIDRRLQIADHYQLGRSLAALRDEGILIVGSGNIVHNLRDAFGRMRSGVRQTPDWAVSFDDSVKQVLSQHDDQTLRQLHTSQIGRMAHPTIEHWLPLIYAQAASDDRDAVHFPTEGFDLGSISMRNVLFGTPTATAL